MIIKVFLNKRSFMLILAKRNKTVAGISEKTGIDKYLIYKFMDGERPIPIPLRKKISRTLPACKWEDIFRAEFQSSGSI